MRKGGQHKPLILDKLLAEDLGTGVISAKLTTLKETETVVVFRDSWPTVGSRLARNRPTRCEGKSSKEAASFNAASENETAKGV